MIIALSIRSFVLIDQLDLDASTGFTALTGETGAGKSIILDALGLVLGGPANRQQVRSGAQQATLSAEFALDAGHPAWAILATHGIDCDPTESLVLRRVVPVQGPSRAFVNAVPVSAAVLCELGETIVEIHGQHAASRLMRPSTHRELLDAYAGLGRVVTQCQTAWQAFEMARSDRETLEDTARRAAEKLDWLNFAVEDLEALAPGPGEVDQLSAQRGVLMQTERINEAIEEAFQAVVDKELDQSLAGAARAIERILRVQGLDQLEGGLAQAATQASEAIERTLIELAEAQTQVRDLSRFGAHDQQTLEEVETRLFALRAAARKYDCQPERLHETFETYKGQLALCTADTDALVKARAQEAQCRAEWLAIAEKLSQERRKHAAGLEAAIMKELKPLHLDRVSVRVSFEEISPAESGSKGLERAVFEVETNPGAGFGPLKSVASGGELARFSLALKCALSESGGVQTMIFDEADQGVGGAVAAAIGERLAGLAEGRQVFAVTHSPQVASSAQRQWRVMKAPQADGQLITHVAQLDATERLEEIARMLSGSSITDEARAAASKLLEAA